MKTHEIWKYEYIPLNAIFYLQQSAAAAADADPDVFTDGRFTAAGGDSTDAG